MQKINDLHNDERCTQYIHDFLDVIENDMLVVLSADRQRKRSPVLLGKLNDMHQKCLTNAEYCLEKIPIKRLYRTPTGTEARLNATATGWIAKNNMRQVLSKHQLEPDRRIHKSRQPEELEKVDMWV